MFAFPEACDLRMTEGRGEGGRVALDLSSEGIFIGSPKVWL